MKASILAWLLAALSLAKSESALTNPMSKVIELLSDLQAKIIKEGEMEQKAFEDYAEWCDDTAKAAHFEIKSLKMKKEKLEAVIAECSSGIETCDSKIAGLAEAIAKAEKELKDATLIRKTENDDFLAAEAELTETVDALDRAIGILEKEIAKNPALLQRVDTSNVQHLIDSVGTIIDAAAFSIPDRKRLLNLIQSRQAAQSSDESKAEEDELSQDAAALGAAGAPDPAAYESHSSSIVDVLEDMKDKADGELSDLRKAEVASKHNFEMLKQSLSDAISADESDLADEKSSKAEYEEQKATSEGDLEGTVNDLANEKKALATAQSTCMQAATDHEGSVRSRGEELEALASAKKVLQETSSGAVSQTYALLQVTLGSTQRSGAKRALPKLVGAIKKLARHYHSAALAQLASRIGAVVRFGTRGGDDPFVKVKGLISDLIDKLVKEGEEEAEEKAYCDSEMKKTEDKKGELQDDIDKLNAKIDKAAAASAKLKDEVKSLEAGLAELVRSQAEMDRIRAEEHEDYAEAKADLELGISGVKRALKVLREYYGAALLQANSAKEDGAGGTIIGILEVVEADFSKNLAEGEAKEADAQSEYDKITQENKVTVTIKQKDAKYKTAEHKALDKAISDVQSDLDTASSELAAVLEYYSKLKDRCIAKPESHEERKRRREAEIAGLKEALDILENEAGFLQRGRRQIRGIAL